MSLVLFLLYCRDGSCTHPYLIQSRASTVYSFSCWEVVWETQLTEYYAELVAYANILWQSPNLLACERSVRAQVSRGWLYPGRVGMLHFWFGQVGDGETRGPRRSVHAQMQHSHRCPL